MGDLLQILRRTGAKRTVTFFVDGVATDSSTPVTVDVTAPDGTVLFDDAATDDEAGDGVYGYQLAAQPECTLLTLDWSGTIGGVAQTVTNYVEVLGNLLFTLPGLRALKVAGSAPFASAADWPDAALLDARAAALDEFQRILGFPPVPRHHRAVVNGNGSTCLFVGDEILKDARLLSVTVNGVAQDVAGYEFNEASQLEAITGFGAGAPFPLGRRNVTVEYVSGWQQVAGDGRNVAMLRAAMRLQPSFSSTTTQVSTPDGAVYSFDPAGQVTRGGTIRHFGVPAIDSWLQRWAEPIPGIA